MTDADYADYLTFLPNIPAQIESLQHKREPAAGSNGLYINPNETEFMRIKQKGAASTLSVKPLKYVNQFTYIGSNITSTESDINIYILRRPLIIHRSYGNLISLIK